MHPAPGWQRGIVGTDFENSLGGVENFPRRHYPDRVLRVFSQPCALVAKHPCFVPTIKSQMASGPQTTAAAPDRGPQADRHACYLSQ
ncbi:protein of unknown function [Pararobbsia alpina]